MNKGVIYFNQGTKCIIRVLVSVYTLRQYYKGNVTVMNVGKPPRFMRKILKTLKVNIHRLEDNGTPPLVRKAQLWEESPYDCTMFIDADTVIVGEIDEYFDKIKKHGFCTGNFANWKTTGGTMSRRIKAYKKIMTEWQITEALEYGKATNTGVFGFMSDSEFLQPWKELTIMAHEAQCSRIPDETACQMLLARYDHWLAPVKWGVSVNKSKVKHLDDARIIHYHGRKHVRNDLDICYFWKDAYWEFREDFAKYEELKQAHGDRRLARYVRECECSNSSK